MNRKKQKYDGIAIVLLPEECAIVKAVLQRYGEKLHAKFGRTRYDVSEVYRLMDSLEDIGRCLEREKSDCRELPGGSRGDVLTAPRTHGSGRSAT